MNTTYGTLENSLSDVFDGFKVDGKSNGVLLQDIFKDGAWLDFHTLPLLNPKLKTTDVNAIVIKHLNAAAINYAWRNQRVWLMSYPMTEAECMSCPFTQPILLLCITDLHPSQ